MDCNFVGIVSFFSKVKIKKNCTTILRGIKIVQVKFTEFLQCA